VGSREPDHQGNQYGEYEIPSVMHLQSFHLRLSFRIPAEKTAKYRSNEDADADMACSSSRTPFSEVLR
jgi:hypothetical protein